MQNYYAPFLPTILVGILIIFRPWKKLKYVESFPELYKNRLEDSVQTVFMFYVGQRSQGCDVWEVGTRAGISDKCRRGAELLCVCVLSERNYELYTTGAKVLLWLETFLEHWTACMDLTWTNGYFLPSPYWWIVQCI